MDEPCFYVLITLCDVLFFPIVILTISLYFVMDHTAFHPMFGNVYLNFPWGVVALRKGFDNGWLRTVLICSFKVLSNLKNLPSQKLFTE